MNTTIKRLLATLAFASGLLLQVTAAEPSKAAATPPKNMRQLDIALSRGDTRSIRVPVPENVRFKDRYTRLYVRTYLHEWNAAVDAAIHALAGDESETAQFRRALYEGQRLAPLTDLNAIAPDEPGDAAYIEKNSAVENHCIAQAQQAVTFAMNKLGEIRRKPDAPVAK